MNLSRKIKDFFFRIGFLFLFMIPVLMHAQSNQISISRENGKSKIIRKTGNTEYKIEYEGKITINDQDSDITGVSNGGFIKISKSAFGSKRKIEIRPEGGQLVKKYYVGNSKTDFEPEGRKWLAEVLPEILRSTTIGASSRVDRFHRQGGVSGVLAEISKLDSDYVKTAYFDLLLKKNPNSSELARIASAAGDEVESDHYLSEILKDNQKAFLGSSEGTRAYIQATNEIESDHYQSEVLKAVIRNSDIADADLGKLLAASDNIGSDHYKSVVLSELLSKRKIEGANLATLVKATQDIDSDHYRSEVLKKALGEGSISESAYNTLLASVADMSSDHYKQEVLDDLLDKNNLKNSTYDNMLKAIASMGSDHYISEVMKKAANMSLTESQIISSLKSIGEMSSDHYITDALRAFAGKVNSSGNSVKEAYRAAAKNINSSHYYGQALKALND